MNSKWISGWDLMKRWAIDEINLQHYILTTDLTAYSSTLEPYTKEDIKIFVAGDHGFHFDLEVNGFGGFYFNINNVIKIERFHKIQIAIKTEKNLYEDSKEQLHRNNDLFPLLRLTALKKHTRLWAAQYDFVKTITLFEAPNSLPCVKYIVTFDLPQTPDPITKSAIKTGKQRQAYIDRFSEPDNDLAIRIRIFKQFLIVFGGLLPGINESFFREIYIEPFKPKYREEWLFTTETPEGVVAECSLVLYTKGTKVSSIPQTKSLPKSKQPVSEYVRKLTIYPDTNDTINIKIPGKPAVTTSGNSLGFYKIPGKEWKLLQDIIKEGQCYIGSDSDRKLLETVEKKLIKGLNTHVNAQIPPKYKLFEKSHKPKGTWKPKFKTQPDGKYSHLSKEQLLQKITYAQGQKHTAYKNDANQEDIHELVAEAKKKGASNDELVGIIDMKPIDTEAYNYIEEGGHITNKP